MTDNDPMTTTVGTTTLTIEGRNGFDDAVREAIGDDLHGATLSTFQVNIGLTCNLACRHCHVSSSPSRPEQMDWPTMRQVLDAARRADAQGMRIIVRTNLTIMLDAGYEDLPAWFAERGVQLVASLPCYTADNVNKQRGLHVYEDSVAVLRKLNAAGYGLDNKLDLTLVYNPLGASLPPATDALECDYRRELRRQCGIEFTRLITITNMPIGRFLHDLERDGAADDYLRLLRASFNPATVEPLMCRHQVHVSHDGTLHDCDFNYGLGMGVDAAAPQHIREFDPRAYIERRIRTGEHCFGCTAGCGSSCGGALA
jgi:radical SAM/Cys-rich protein